MTADDGRGLPETEAAANACFDGQVMVEGFVLIAAAVEADTGERVWAIRSDPQQSVFATMGLARLAQAYLDEHVNAHLGYEGGS